MSELVDNLLKLCEAHEDALNELRSKIKLIEGVPKAKALVGKCFRCQNTYGFGSKKWWIYKRVVDHKLDRLVIDCFEQDSNGKIEILYYSGDEYSGYFNNSTWIPISEKAYFAAYKRLVKKIIKKSNKRG
jgi:hypothetical protein